jgi:hypothetical protein
MLLSLSNFTLILHSFIQTPPTNQLTTIHSLNPFFAP